MANSYIKSRKHAVARAVPQVSGAAAATLIALSAPAIAQQQPSRVLPEIRVEGSVAADFKADTSANPKFTAPLVNTPQTVQVIKEQVLRDQGATTLTEALRNTPGVGTFFLGENGNTNTGDAVFMRGFDSSSAIFVDGIRDLGSVSRDTFNIDQVEVVKGPSGTDVGRTSPTGYINLVTKKPKLDDSFTGSLGFGSADFKRGSIDWNKSLSGENGIGAAFRLNAVAEDAGVAGRDFVKNKRWSIAPSLAFGLNSPTRVYLDYVHVKQNNVPDGGVPTIGLPGYSTPDATAIRSGLARRNYLNYAQRVDSSNFYGTSSDFDHVTTDMFTARVEHDLTPDITIRNTTRYAKTQQDYMLTAFMGGGLTASTAGVGQLPAVNSGFINTVVPTNPATWTITRNLPTNKDQTNTIFTNQTSVSAKFNTGSISHTFNGGLEFIRETQRANNYYAAGYPTVGTTFALAGSWPAANLYAPDRNVLGYNRIPNGTGSDGSTDTIGLFAFDTIKFNEQWQLTGGLRYDHYSTNYDATALTLARTGNNPQTATIAPTRLKLSDSLWSGKIGLVLQADREQQRLRGLRHGGTAPGWRQLPARSRRHRQQRRAHRLPAAEGQDLRTRHQVGRAQQAPRADGRALPHRRQQRGGAGLDLAAVLPDRQEARAGHRTRRVGCDHRQLGRDHRLHDDEHPRAQRPLGAGRRLDLAGLHPEARLHAVDHLPVAVRPDDRRRRALQRQAVPRHRRRGRHAGLRRVVLGGRRHGVLPDQQERGPAAERLQPVRQGLRGGHQQVGLPLHAGHAALVQGHRELRVLIVRHGEPPARAGAPRCDTRAPARAGAFFLPESPKMMLHVPEVLSPDQVRRMRATLDATQWVDGRETVGDQGAQVKRNRQLSEHSPVGRELAKTVLAALARNPLFFSAALPARFVPPLFNRYEGGEHYGLHVDGAVRAVPGSEQPLRTDLSCTLFLCDPDDYDGGELEVVDTYGSHEVKLPAGDLILYPSSSLHRVHPVTRGARVCAFFWAQSMVRNDQQRAMLFELDQNIQKLRARLGESEETVALTGHYHNLLRLWSEI